MVSVAGFRFSVGSVLSLNAPLARLTSVVPQRGTEGDERCLAGFFLILDILTQSGNFLFPSLLLCGLMNGVYIVMVGVLSLFIIKRVVLLR